MTQEIDEFATSLLEEAKRFLERASASNGDASEAPNLHAALMLAACSLEAHLNAVCDEMAKRTNVPHERSILLEREVRLTAGEFKLEKALKIHRIEDRLDFLHKRFGQVSVPDVWRSNLKFALNLRNDLTHPKSVPNITVAVVEKALRAIIETIDALYRAIYRKPFPAASLQLDSTLAF